MPALQTLVNAMLDEYDRRFGSDSDRSILISSKARATLPSHGSNVALHHQRGSIKVQSTYRDAIVDAVPHDHEWLVAVVPIALEDALSAAQTLYGDVRSGTITTDFEQLRIA